MDIIHETFVLLPALGLEAYTETADVAATDMANVMKPPKNGEETARMFDKEHEDVMLVKESETFSASLPTSTKEAGTNPDVLERFEANNWLGVSRPWKLATSGQQGVVPTRS